MTKHSEDLMKRVAEHLDQAQTTRELRQFQVESLNLLRDCQSEIASLQRQLEATRALLIKSQEQVCSMLCPSHWHGERPPHHELCQTITKLKDCK